MEQSIYHAVRRLTSEGSTLRKCKGVRNFIVDGGGGASYLEGVTTDFITK